MGWKKLQLIQQAYTEVGLPPFAFDLAPEQLESALQRMDAMVAEWQGRGVLLGYPLGADSSANQDSGVDLHLNAAVYSNLALRLAPTLGKTVSQETKSAASDGWDMLMLTAAQPPQQQFPDTLPRGAGSKPWRGAFNPFFPPPDRSPLSAPQSDVLDIAKD